MRIGPVALVLLAAACGSPIASPDAGAPDAGGLLDPAAPAPPAFLPCPSGWSAREVDGAFEVCEPPTGAPCAAGLERFSDSADCVPVGAACPSGEWATPPDGARVVYVRAGASGGEGTSALPYGSIQTAIERAPPGAVILVGKGTYDETIDVFGGSRVIGACAAETILAPTAAGGELFAVAASERDARLEAITIRPTADLGGIDVRGELAIEGVVIENAADEAIVVHEAGALGARSLVVRDVRTLTPLYGHGAAAGDATMSIERAIFERCPGGAIIASTGSEITARAITVRDSGSEIDGAPQLVAQGGGTLVVSDSLIEDATGSGLYGNLGGVLRVDQIVVRRMRSDFERTVPAAGVLLREGSRLAGRRIRIEDVDVFGVAFALGTTGEIEDVYIANVARTAYDAGFAVSARNGLVMRRAWLASAERVGILATGPGTLELEDVTVARCGSPDFFSDAVLVSDLAGTVRRMRVVESRGAGFVAFGPELALTIEDIEVADALSDTMQLRGRGIELREGRAMLSRVRVERAREAGIIAFAGAELEMSDVRVLDTLARDCSTTSCPDEPGGTALVAVDASATLSRFELAGARLCGALLTGAGELDLYDGEIRGALVGACVQRDDFDVARLTDDVLYRDNGINVQSTTHDVPPPSDPLLPVDI